MRLSQTLEEYNLSEPERARQYHDNGSYMWVHVHVSGNGCVIKHCTIIIGCVAENRQVT